MVRKTISSKHAGERNEQLVLNLLRAHGELSQSQLCRLAHFNSSTASYITARLREKGLISERPGHSNRRGVKPTIITINPQGYVIGSIEIGPGRLAVALSDFFARPIETIKAPTGGDLSPEHIAHLIEINLKGLLGRHGMSEAKLLGIGVTVSGSVMPDGLVKLSSPMGWRQVPLRLILQASFKAPVRVYGTRVRLFAEVDLHQNESFQNVLYFNVGNGVGGDVLIDGHLLRGATARLGELGHIVVDPAGPVCGCGHQGCLEAFVSGPALARQICHDMVQGVSSVMKQSLVDTDLPEEVVKKWGDALCQGDAYARQLADRVAEHISRVAAMAINCFDPDIILLAGYVCEQCIDILEEKIITRMASDVYDNTSRQIVISAAKAGSEALIHGAAIAIYQESMHI